MTHGVKGQLWGLKFQLMNFFATFNLTQGNPIKPTHLGTTKMPNNYQNNQYYLKFDLININVN
jgi:hypothetical protein